MLLIFRLHGHQSRKPAIKNQKYQQMNLSLLPNNPNAINN